MAPADSLTVAALQASAAGDDLFMPAFLIPLKLLSNINRHPCQMEQIDHDCEGERGTDLLKRGPRAL